MNCDKSIVSKAVALTFIQRVFVALDIGSVCNEGCSDSAHIVRYSV